jgi:outer membrane protein OmpA-like peptidoglycan-associated protein
MWLRELLMSSRGVLDCMVKWMQRTFDYIVVRPIVDVIKRIKQIYAAISKWLGSSFVLKEPKKLFDFVKYYIQCGTVFVVGGAVTFIEESSIRLHGVTVASFIGYALILLSFILFVINTTYGLGLIFSSTGKKGIRLLGIVFSSVFLMSVILGGRFLAVDQLERVRQEKNNEKSLLDSIAWSLDTYREIKNRLEGIEFQILVDDNSPNQYLGDLNDTTGKGIVVVMGGNGDPIVVKGLGDYFKISSDKARVEALTVGKSSIQFIENSSVLNKSENKVVLDSYYSLINTEITYDFVLVGGASADGDFNRNIELGVLRAGAVRDYLINEGVSADRLRVSSVGDVQVSGEENIELRRVLLRVY